MAELAIILKKLREKRGITIIMLSELSGVGRGTIGDMERGKIKRGSPESLEKIAKGLKLNEEERNELFSVLVPKDIGKKIIGRQDSFNLEESKVNTVILPVYGKASAGNGYINLETELYHMPIKKGNFSKRSFLVEISGNSMSPTLTDGDFALVDPEDVDYMKNKIYVVTYNNETFIKRIECKKKFQLITLKSDNEEYPDIDIEITEFIDEYFKIEGRVIQVISNKYL